MSIRTATLGAATLLAAAVFAGPALADGMPSRGKIASEPPRGCTTAGNVGLTTDYVFRGISQTFNDPAVQGGVDFTCGRFYAGVWASNVDFGAISPGDAVGNIEIDIYAGFKHGLGPVTLDVGFIYYAYPGQPAGIDLDDLELKLGASGSLWKGGSAGVTLFYSTEFERFTVEGTLGHELPRVGIFTPTISGTLGHVEFDNGDDYNYWNLGLSASFLERWSVDLRYWDTNVAGGCPAATIGGIEQLCDERFVGSVKYSF
jgi:uncharacterized protein (TIGR02001 family)